MQCSIGELGETWEAGPNSKEEFNQAQGSLMKSVIMERQCGNCDRRLEGHVAGSQRSQRSCIDIAENQT